MTIGDVLAAIAALFALGATWTATILLAALAFPTRARRAQETLTASPGACLARGAGVVLLFLIVGRALTAHPAGPLKLLGYTLWACLGALAALGSAGVARLVGERIQAVGTPMAPFASLTRGAIVYVVAGFLPLIGWFLIAPAALLLSVGSGVAVLKAGGALPCAPTGQTPFPITPADTIHAGAHGNAPVPRSSDTSEVPA